VTRRARRTMFLAGALGLVALLAWGFAGLPPFGVYRGPYGDIVNAIAEPARHVTGVVTAINFDIRGFDTIGEEFILFAAVMGVTLLLRAQRDEEERTDPQEEAEHRRVPGTSDAVRVMGLTLVGPVVLYGIYVTVHAHLTPGGGFQGGVVLATALLIVYLAGEFLVFDRVSPDQLIEVGEGVGAGGFVAIGLATMLAGDTLLDNVLPLGRVGDLFSGGTIPLINLFVALAVTSGFVLILTEFLEQTLLLRRRTAA
jgi:multicomponent Na+:H+ antiporter subunit B